MGMAAILVNELQPFKHLSFPQPKEAPYKILAKLAQRLQRRSFEILNIFPIQMDKEAKLTLP